MTDTEKEAIFQLAESLVGSSQQKEKRKDVLIGNVTRRMQHHQCPSLVDYLHIALESEPEFEELLSALTIHLTGWFRESEHFEWLYKEAQVFFKTQNEDMRVWCAASSTGEETYSVFSTLQKAKREVGKGNFKIYSSDIDPVSVKKAQLGKFDRIRQPAHRFWNFDDWQSDESSFSLKDEFRSHFQFFEGDLSQTEDYPHIEFHVIFCRNVLFYFSESYQKRIVKSLIHNLSSEGTLILGQSDQMFKDIHQLKRIQPSVYKLLSPFEIKSENEEKLKLLIIDDSPTVRLVLRKILSTHFEVYEADSAESADQIVKNHRFDAFSVDLNMPKVNGAEWIQNYRSSGGIAPIVVVSDSNPDEGERIFGALSKGAQDYIPKRKLSEEPDKVCELFFLLAKKRQNTDQLEIGSNILLHHSPSFQPEAFVLGASTGGPETLVGILKNFPQPCPPIIVVQHISKEFSDPFFRRLSREANLPFVAVTCGDEFQLEPSTLYGATDDVHIRLKRGKDHSLIIFADASSPQHGHRPAVDPVFESVASAEVHSVNILLTGMGKDGANGLKVISESRNPYFLNLAQDERTSIVFGMPKQAIEVGAVHLILSDFEIRQLLESSRIRTVTPVAKKAG